jgi:hypothetical protein
MGFSEVRSSQVGWFFCYVPNAAITWPQGEVDFDSYFYYGGSGEWRCSTARQYGETCCNLKAKLAFANGRHLLSRTEAKAPH